MTLEPYDGKKDEFVRYQFSLCPTTVSLEVHTFWLLGGSSPSIPRQAAQELITTCIVKL